MINNIKHRIRLLIKRLLYYRGFVIERIPNANELVVVHELVRKYELKKLANNIRKINNQKLYNNLLKKFVADWDDKIASADFIGYGSGEDNLGIYRKVCFEDSCFFEKVYFNDSNDLLKVEWFYEHIFPVLEKYLKTVKLHKAIKGDLITIVYFEYIDLSPLPEGVFHSDLLEISKKMFKMSKNNVDLIQNAPDFFKHYRLYIHYVYNIKIAEEVISKRSGNRLTVTMIEKIIDLQPLLITHGDIYHNNVLVDNYIIDWDSFGFFPHGLEVALIFATNIKHSTFETLQKLLKEEYKVIVGKDQWDGFELSCWYFYLIFTAQDEKEATHKTWQKDAFNIVERLYDKITSKINVPI